MGDQVTASINGQLYAALRMPCAASRTKTQARCCPKPNSGAPNRHRGADSSKSNGYDAAAEEFRGSAVDR